ncbi:DUF899 domain-containing protein [Pseudemcibacter aquimaris]|uniref:DUF899 domain-containing protein n=1 Tax=Pseudemcibacter aquimaris TaxID=2857064 RepID=UPI0020129643|nr:DUF899 domain-containing protein [Pseudemcibacter aquimaris]MCC3862320.1 DUF899 domain-containing protein [Pseudemcibacter aquimaris]WDU59068.1 DUF899 domain-containing protein [Pseudemcibacter aquimaris]
MGISRNIVSKEEWQEARKAFLKKEKAHLKAADALSAERRALPWVEITENYQFDGPDGKVGLAELFKDHNQLIIQHFMYGPEWEAGCPGCSLMADSHQGVHTHLEQAGVRLVVISNGPLDKLDAYKKRMGWGFEWYSSLGSPFNYDFDVSFTAEQIEQGDGQYNYAPKQGDMTELHGVSCFYKDDDGKIYHTYSTYSRGVDTLMGVYQYIDLTPLGRQEDGPMSWLKRHDEYV